MHDVNHPSIAATIGNLGSIYQLLAKLDEAETMQQECLEMQRAIYWRFVSHRGAAITLYNLGTLLVKREKVEHGLSMVQDSLCMFRNLFGAIHIIRVLRKSRTSFRLTKIVLARKQSR